MADSQNSLKWTITDLSKQCLMVIFSYLSVKDQLMFSRIPCFDDVALKRVKSLSNIHLTNGELMEVIPSCPNLKYLKLYPSVFTSNPILVQLAKCNSIIEEIIPFINWNNICKFFESAKTNNPDYDGSNLKTVFTQQNALKLIKRYPDLKLKFRSGGNPFEPKPNLKLVDIAFDESSRFSAILGNITILRVKCYDYLFFPQQTDEKNYRLILKKFKSLKTIYLDFTVTSLSLLKNNHDQLLISLAQIFSIPSLMNIIIDSLYENAWVNNVLKTFVDTKRNDYDSFFISPVIGRRNFRKEMIFTSKFLNTRIKMLEFVSKFKKSSRCFGFENELVFSKILWSRFYLFEELLPIYQSCRFVIFKPHSLHTKVVLMVKSEQPEHFGTKCDIHIID